jgi:hypothetical protein
VVVRSAADVVVRSDIVVVVMSASVVDVAPVSPVSPLSSSLLAQAPRANNRVKAALATRVLFFMFALFQI